MTRYTYGVTQEDRRCRALVVPVQAIRVVTRQIRLLLARNVTWIPCNAGEVTDSMLSRKTSMGVSWMTVPQTDTGRWVEDTKASE